MSDHTYNFNITMTCGGCSGAVERVLKKLDGQYAPMSRKLAHLILTLEQASSPSTFPSTSKQHQ